MTQNLANQNLANQNLAKKTLFSGIAALLIAFASASPASAQRADSWVDITGGGVGAGASADGTLKYAKTKSSSKNGVQFGNGFAVGAGPNGIAVSNSIGAGAGPLGVAHNVNLSIGANGTHLSHGGVVSQGGSRRVTSGGSAGVHGNGTTYGGSTSTGYGNRTHAWSKSHTRNVAPAIYQGQSYPSSSTRRVVSGFRFR